MSYARWGQHDSDVYVFLSTSGKLECCGCSLSDEWTYDSTDAMIAHLREHQAAGDHVPADCIARLEEKREDNDAFIAAGGLP